MSIKSGVSLTPEEMYLPCMSEETREATILILAVSIHSGMRTVIGACFSLIPCAKNASPQTVCFTGTD